MEKARHIAVIGSLSMDLVLTMPKLPQVGETLKGNSFNTFVGGKGNNQALAMARLGARTAMLGKLGKDTYAEAILSCLSENGVECRHMLSAETVGTGIANIWVNSKGENEIVIIANSNGELKPSDIDEQVGIFEDATLLVMQLEIPLETVIYAAEQARAKGIAVLLNPAPAPVGGLPQELLSKIDYIVPNETETEILTGIDPSDEVKALAAGKALLDKGIGCAILTLGARGAVIIAKEPFEKAENDAANSIFYKFTPAPPVKVIDSTAAGDAFVGGMAAALSRGESLSQAVAEGCAAGSLACTKAGAAPSLPSRLELDKLLKLPA